MIAYLIICFLIGAGFAVFCAWFLSPTQKGKRGEKKVNKILDKCNGKVYKNYIIKDEQGKSHQIDHILVNKCGVFVIETKNYHGRIYGKDNQQNWTQVLNYGKVKNQFYSPVKQNKTHCFMIKDILPKDVKVDNIVVFVRNNTDYIESNYTIGVKELEKYLNNFNETLDETHYQMACRVLDQHRDLLTTDKEHVQNIKKQQADIENNICPRCGGKLVLRHGKNGDFYGCENFPKCRFIKK